ncbi:hypothetical protein [Streptomyces sp. NPDC058872]|uniref:hypothetical protein n=1 Tax=Streptomyces sp. NPDC058872 TaxID=3346661 RepID=UPI00368FBBE0
MTSTADRADTTQHPDVSEISDLTEGLLPPTRSAAVRRHVDGCALCGDVRTSLEEIRSLLGTLPGPSRMPADIAGRIDAALAAEALLSATSPEDNTPVSRETPPVSDEGPSPTAPAPATDRPTQTRPAGHPRATTGPGRSRAPRRRRIALLSTIGAAFGAVLLGASLYLSHTGTVTAGRSADTEKADTLTEAAATGSFSGALIEDRVHDLLAGEHAPKTPQGLSNESTSAQVEGNTPRSSGTGDVPECVLAGTGRSDEVLGYERGDYQGAPAYLLVLADPGDSTRVRAYVLAASCANGSGQDGQPVAELLVSQTYPRS